MIYLQETVAISGDVSGDLEEVEGVQRKFDDFQKVFFPAELLCFFLLSNIPSMRLFVCHTLQLISFGVMVYYRCQTKWKCTKDEESVDWKM